MFLGILVLVAAMDMIEQEIMETRHLVGLLKEKIDLIETFRLEVKDKGIEIPEDEEWKTMPGLIPQPEYDFLPNRLKHLSTLSLTTKGVDFIALKSKDSNLNIGFLVCENSLLSVFNMKGVILSTYAITNILHCAGSSTPDEPYIAIVTQQDLIILSYDGVSIQYISSHNLFNDTATPTILINYSRLGKKFWLVGDDWGRVSFYGSNGDFVGQGPTGTSKITTLDKFGSQIIFAGDHKTGILNLATMEIYQLCEPAIYPIIDVAQDFSATILYAACENGDIFVYDTKHVTSSSAPSCKSVGRMKYPGKPNKIAVIRGSLLVVSEDIMCSFNVTGLENDVFYPPACYKVDWNDKDFKIKSLRLPNSGNYLLMYGLNQIQSFDVGFGAVITATGGWDFGGDKILSILMVIGGIVMWRYFLAGRGKDKKNQVGNNKVKGIQGGSAGKRKVQFSETPQTFTYSDSD
ncbi:hypothetical protein SteCoe_23697 [Stentor coeruleus]|uniref:Uncharacterized protein n=1 Tax=Stentor coeruleus TaxID=5963 RepID=A0A1R2BJ98_9CILI|nr:hypothetical protein SteCoe_23697 [Stentor coeruleus]